jgi:hypothetical protein
MSVFSLSWRYKTPRDRARPKTTDNAKETVTVIDTRYKEIPEKKGRKCVAAPTHWTILQEQCGFLTFALVPFTL